MGIISRNRCSRSFGALKFKRFLGRRTLRSGHIEGSFWRFSSSVKLFYPQLTILPSSCIIKERKDRYFYRFYGLKCLNNLIVLLCCLTILIWWRKQLLNVMNNTAFIFSLVAGLLDRPLEYQLISVNKSNWHEKCDLFSLEFCRLFQKRYMKHVQQIQTMATHQAFKNIVPWLTYRFRLDLFFIVWSSENLHGM